MFHDAARPQKSIFLTAYKPSNNLVQHHQLHHILHITITHAFDIFIVTMKFTSAISAIALVVFAQTVIALPLTKNSADEDTGSMKLTITDSSNGEFLSTTVLTADLSDILRSVEGDNNTPADTITFELTITDDTAGETVVLQGDIKSFQNE
jgi:hypothetical protein